MRKVLLIAFCILSMAPLGTTWGAGEDTIQISIENKSAQPILLQVRDEVCRTPVSDACTQANFIVQSMECRKTPLMEACVRAKEKLSGGGCVEGLIYEKFVAINEKISLSICVNPSGYGRVSLRDLNRNTIWKSSFLLGNGDRLTYP